MIDKIFDFIRKRDQIGVPVSLNLNGNSSHQTSIGGCCSLFAMLMILAVVFSEI